MILQANTKKKEIKKREMQALVRFKQLTVTENVNYICALCYAYVEA